MFVLCLELIIIGSGIVKMSITYSVSFDTSKKSLKTKLCVLIAYALNVAPGCNASHIQDNLHKNYYHRDRGVEMPFHARQLVRSATSKNEEKTNINCWFNGWPDRGFDECVDGISGIEN